MDRRTTLANDRVVHDALAEQFPELSPVQSTQYVVADPCVDVLRAPAGARERQMRFGDGFEVIERRDGYAFGLGPQASPYAGWVQEAALARMDETPVAPHWVSVRQTHAYSAPDFKSKEILALPHLAQVDVSGTEGRFSNTQAGWIPTAHLTQDVAHDPVSVAELYLGTPYLWGGNSCWGIDCSGLIQAGLLACGVSCLGDSDQQEATLGETLRPGTPYERGDVLFWKGHVAWVADPDRLLHANAFHMAVTYEPIKQALARIEDQGDGPVTRHARLSL